MASQTNIAIIVPTLNAGGMERAATLTANILAASSTYRVIILTLLPTPPFFALDKRVQLVSPDFDPTKCPRVIGALRTINFLRASLRRESIDCCISFGDRYNSLSIIATLGTRTKAYVSNRQNPHLSNGRFIDLLNQVCYPFADGLVAQTKYAATVFARKRLNRQICCIPNPVPIQEAGAVTRMDWVVNVGRFADQKNQSELIETFDRIYTKPWELWLVGDGPKLPLAKQVHAKTTHREQIKFAGCVSDVSRFYKAGSIFAFTSRSEGFPNALAEAMSYGMAVIAYDCKAGPADLIDHGKNGLLIPDGNQREFAAGLNELMRNQTLRQRLGLEAKKKAETFSENEYFRRLVAFISRDAR
jgi:GalNAc-alpha-(1->4)-GalNAc-alpha-(1->3)-diNAcBac-PP-undecaprenol alpha-1,4-N-acetyl-D-galactosaminyltransferase